MSNHLISLAYTRDLRTPMRKALLVLMADKASDDGSGIWASKQSMADELCCSKQTVISTIQGLIRDGIVSEAGQKKSPNGFTVLYALNITVIKALPLVRCHFDRSERLTGQGDGPVKEDDLTGQAAGPEPSLTSSPLVSSNELTSPKPAPKKVSESHLVEAWNEVAAPQGAIRCARVLPERKKRMGSFLKRYAVEDITEAIAAVARSEFLTGRTSKGFRADITFLFSAEHMNRLLEGFYERQ